MNVLDLFFFFNSQKVIKLLTFHQALEQIKVNQELLFYRTRTSLKPPSYQPRRRLVLPPNWQMQFNNEWIFQHVNLSPKMNEIQTKGSGLGRFAEHKCAVLLVQKCFVFVFPSKDFLVQHNNKIFIINKIFTSKDDRRLERRPLFRWFSVPRQHLCRQITPNYKLHHHFSGFNVTFGALREVQFACP